jgi:hypothetical protein
MGNGRWSRHTYMRTKSPPIPPMYQHASEVVFTPGSFGDPQPKVGVSWEENIAQAVSSSFKIVRVRYQREQGINKELAHLPGNRRSHIPVS